MGNLLSVSIESAYLDWLAGEFGDILLDEIVDVTKDLLKIEQNCFLEVVYKSKSCKMQRKGPEYVAGDNRYDW